MQITSSHLAILARCRDLLNAGFAELPAVPHPPADDELLRVLEQTALRLQDNYPYQHPFYLGQMLRPPHPVAWLAYSLAMMINPNNHAHDGGRASSALELEVVSDLARMFGWKTHLGHLCSGGTIANFEALWVAREMTSGSGIAASAMSHYTHERLTRLLQLPYESIRVDWAGRMDLDDLEDKLRTGRIGTVVATLGTTGLGAVDPLDQIVELQQKYPFRIHVDAAYGGYFRLDSTLRPETLRAFQATDHADSLVVDPHKHGLQPYGCGCVLFKDRSVAAIYHHESPYTYFTSDDLHLGEISLECSRAGAAATALWATTQLFPLIPNGSFARGLEDCRQAARDFTSWLHSKNIFQPVVEPELDIVVWMVRSESSSAASQAAREFFNAAARHNVHLALLTLPRSLCEPAGAIRNWDTEEVTCLRACLMKPEHREWLPRIIRQLEQVLQQGFSAG